MTDEPWLRLAGALAIGLLIGAERERRKGEGPLRSPAGIRTFALASLLGGMSFHLGREVLLGAAMLAMAAFCYAAYQRNYKQDPGLTSETALLLTVLLGGLAQLQPATASGLAVAVTILLAARSRLHHLVRAALSVEELTDGLIFAAGLGGASSDAGPISRALWRYQPTHDMEDCDPFGFDQCRGICRRPPPGTALRASNHRAGIGIRFEYGDYRLNGITGNIGARAGATRYRRGCTLDRRDHCSDGNRHWSYQSKDTASAATTAAFGRSHGVGVWTCVDILLRRA